MARLINLSNADVDQTVNFDGYEAKDAGGEKVGKVDSVIADSDSMKPRYIVVDSGGMFSSKQYVVPVGEVARVDDDDKSVMFKSLTKNTLKSGSYPQYDNSWWDQNDGENFGRHEQQVAGLYAPRTGKAMADTARPVDYQGDLYTRPAKGAQRLQLMEEHLQANKERYQAGAVKLGKRVIERQESIDVPVTEERVVIERRAATGATRGEIGKDQTISMPVERERVTLQKDTVVTEEVGLRKEATQHTERVQDTVRKEELVVDDQQGLLERQGERATREANPPRRDR